MYLWYFGNPNMAASILAHHFKRPGLGIRTAWRALSGISRLTVQLSALGGALWRPLRNGVLRWHLKRETMRGLMALDDQVLKDIGLPRSEIEGLAQNYAEKYTAGK